MGKQLTKGQVRQLLGIISEAGAQLAKDMQSGSRIQMPVKTLLQPSDRDVQKLAFARGGFDNSALTERGIRGIFFAALENQFDTTWAAMVGLMMQSDTLTETHRWLGQTPGVREWVGGLLAEGMLDFQIQIENKDYESTIKINTKDFLLDKTGHILLRIGELASRFGNHWEELLVALKEANGTCYDGQAFFSASHSSGDSGTLSNLLTSSDIPALGVSDTSRPTREEAAAILVQLAAYLYTYTDDKGKKANQGAKSFLVVCPPAMAPGFAQAISHQLYITGGDPLVKGLGWSFNVVPEPELATATVGYFYRIDAPASKPYILQTLEDPTLDVIGMDSEHRKLNNELVFSAKASRNVGLGEWRQAAHFTLS